MLYEVITQDPTLPSVGFFEIAWVGIPSAVAGILFVLLFSRWLLPDRRPPVPDPVDPKQYAVEMLVEPGSPLVGRAIEEAGLHFNWNAVKNEIYNNTFWNVGPPDQALIDCWVPKRDEKQTNVADNILYNNISDVRPWWHSGDGSKYRVDEKEFIRITSYNVCYTKLLRA